MPATVTTLEHEIGREERYLGMPTDHPVGGHAIRRRRVQVAFMMLGCAATALFAVALASGPLQLCAVALAGGFGVYAIEQDRHMHRLASLCGDSQRITFAVADELLLSGALVGDRGLLNLRDGIGRSAESIAEGLSRMLPTCCARVRLVGPSGEVPIAAERNCGREHAEGTDTAAAVEAISTRAPALADDGDRRVVAVPLWRGDIAVGVLEAVARTGAPLDAADVDMIEAFGLGVIAALSVPLPAPWFPSRA